MPPTSSGCSITARCSGVVTFISLADGLLLPVVVLLLPAVLLLPQKVLLVLRMLKPQPQVVWMLQVLLQ